MACVNGKTSDLCVVEMANSNLPAEPDYVPGDIGIGSYDYIQFNYCLDCGTLRGKFPLNKTSLERKDEVND